MRRLLLSGLVTAALCASAPAQAAPYNDYLARLDQLITSYATFNFTPQEIASIDSAVRSRPEGFGPEMYGPYIDLVERTADKLATFGYSPDELQVLSLLTRAAPQVNPRQYVNDRAYRRFLDFMGRSIKRMATFDFDQNELQAIDILSQVAPSLELTQPAYDGAYAAWTVFVADLERTFSTFGISGPEQQVLERARRLRPRLLQVAAEPMPPPGYQPGYQPAPGYQQVPPPPPAPVYQPAPPAPVYAPAPPAPVYAPGPPPGRPWQAGPGGYPPAYFGRSMGLQVQSFPLCNKNFTVQWVGQTFQPGRPAPSMLMLLRDRGELVEVDTGSCQIRWLADDVVGVRPMRRARALVLVRGNGTVFVARHGGEVFQVVADMVGIAPSQDYEGQGYGWELLDRNGGRHLFELAPGDNFAVRMDQATPRTRLLYRSNWRPL